MSRVATLLVIGILLVSQPVGHAQSDPLSFFKNYFITGDYVVGSVGLRGRGGISGTPGVAKGVISIAGVPSTAEIVAAFLYWQTVSKDSLGPDSGSAGAKFNGYQLTTPGGSLAKVLVSDGTSPCWSSGGGTGSSGGQHRTYTFRADVLRFLPVDATGNLVVNGSHVVEIPTPGRQETRCPLDWARAWWLSIAILLCR